MKQFVAMMEMDGVKLNIKEDALREIAKMAVERKTGARGLRSIMENLLMDLMYSVPSKSDVKEIHIDEEVVEGKSKAKLKR